MTSKKKVRGKTLKSRRDADKKPTQERLAELCLAALREMPSPFKATDMTKHISAAGVNVHVVAVGKALGRLVRLGYIAQDKSGKRLNTLTQRGIEHVTGVAQPAPTPVQGGDVRPDSRAAVDPLEPDLGLALVPPGHRTDMADLTLRSDLPLFRYLWLQAAHHMRTVSDCLSSTAGDRKKNMDICKMAGDMFIKAMRTENEIKPGARIGDGPLELPGVTCPALDAEGVPIVSDEQIEDEKGKLIQMFKDAQSLGGASDGKD